MFAVAFVDFAYSEPQAVHIGCSIAAKHQGEFEARQPLGCTQPFCTCSVLTVVGCIRCAYLQDVNSLNGISSLVDSVLHVAAVEANYRVPEKQYGAQLLGHSYHTLLEHTSFDIQILQTSLATVFRHTLQQTAGAHGLQSEQHLLQQAQVQPEKIQKLWQ